MSTVPHILVDATAIPRNRGGVGRYLEHLIPALSQLGLRLSVVAQPHDIEWIEKAAPRARVIAAKAASRSRPARLGWEQLGLPRLAGRLGADLIFSPHYTMPLFSRVPVVVTLHDATFFSHPALHSRAKRLFFRWWSTTSLSRAAACIVPSQATKSELLRWVRPKSDRMQVAYHGVDLDRFHPPTGVEVDSARDLAGGEARWIAFLGTLEPRKNVGNLVRAFERLIADGFAQATGLGLVLVGGRGWDSELEALLAASPAKASIHRLGFVDDGQLAGLLGGAELVAYPSLGEGFGLPVLEAMACGAPVLTTALLALPEVGGDVAVYSEPDAASLAQAMSALLADEAQRSERGRRGVERARGFSWEASARAHLAVFAAQVGGGG